MKGFKFLFYAGLVAGVLGVLGLVTLDSWSLFNPVQRHIVFRVNDAQTIVELDRRHLRVGTPRVEVESWLSKHGFESSQARREFISRLKLHLHPSLKGEPLDHTADAVFERDATSLACALRFTVLIDYDDAQTIETVQGFHSATGCR